MLTNYLFFGTNYFVIISYYRGRGAFESMGAGLEMIPGDIAFKVRDLPLRIIIIILYLTFFSKVKLRYA